MSTSSEELLAERDAIGGMLGRIPSGVFVLSVGNGAGSETGMLASWVQQASFEPPMVTVAVNRDRWFLGWLNDSSSVALSLVGSGQKEFLKQFGKGFGPNEAAFDGVEVTRGKTGLPILAGALGAMEGLVSGRVDAGDHILLLVEITSAQLSSDAAATPMVHLRKSGFRY